MFQMSRGIANGASTRQNCIQRDSLNTREASSNSTGTVRGDWWNEKAIFQAGPVKIAKTAANSAPSTRPGVSDMKNTTVTEMKPRIGTDCRMSSSGTRNDRATFMLH